MILALRRTPKIGEETPGDAKMQLLKYQTKIDSQSID